MLSSSGEDLDAAEMVVASQIRIVDELQQKAIADPLNVDIATALSAHAATLSSLWSMIFVRGEELTMELSNEGYPLPEAPRLDSRALQVLREGGHVAVDFPFRLGKSGPELFGFGRPPATGSDEAGIIKNN